MNEKSNMKLLETANIGLKIPDCNADIVRHDCAELWLDLLVIFEMTCNHIVGGF